MEDCIFCKIISGDIPSTKVYEDDYVLAFKDINPLAPVHDVIVPKKHISSANAIDESNSMIIAKIFEAIPKIAKIEGLNDGYNVLNNCGQAGGQTVMHIHFHLLGGFDLSSLLANNLK